MYEDVMCISPHSLLISTLYSLYTCIIYLSPGGSSIQDECTAHVRSAGDLLPGQVYTSGPGTLPCRHVVHAVSPRWSEQPERAEDLLYQAVYSAMEEASKRGRTSISIPAIGSGIFNIPVAVSTHNVVSAVVAFCGDGGGAGVSVVHLIDTKENTVNHFQQSLTAARITDIELLGAAETSAPSTTPPADREVKGPQGGSGPYTAVDAHTVQTTTGLQVTVVKAGLEKQQVTKP